MYLLWPSRPIMDSPPLVLRVQTALTNAHAPPAAKAGVSRLCKPRVFGRRRCEGLTPSQRHTYLTLLTTILCLTALLILPSQFRYGSAAPEPSPVTVALAVNGPEPEAPSPTLQLHPKGGVRARSAAAVTPTSTPLTTSTSTSTAVSPTSTSAPTTASRRWTEPQVRSWGRAFKSRVNLTLDDPFPHYRSAADLTSRASAAVSCMCVLQPCGYAGLDGYTNPNAWPAPGPPSQLELSRPVLRSHALALFHATAELRLTPSSTWNGYSGPWMERHWMDAFLTPVATLVDGVEVIDPFDLELFAPMIPLFIPWTDLIASWKGDEVAAFMFGLKLASLLQPGYLYVTVLQHMNGLYLEQHPSFRPVLRNILVLSSGGRGHVALPLLSAPLKLSHTHPSTSTLVSFAGSASHGALRRAALRDLESTAASVGFKSVIYSGRDWVQVMSNASVTLAPRGWGRTSFRLYEALQSGTVPVVVYDDLWMPYTDEVEAVEVQGGGRQLRYNLKPPAVQGTGAGSSYDWSRVAYIVHGDEFKSWLEGWSRDKDAAAQVGRMEAAIVEDAELFTYEGVMKHIHAFIVALGQGYDASALGVGLKCAPKPEPPGEWRAPT